MAKTAGRKRKATMRTAEQIAQTDRGPRPLPDLQRTKAGRAPSTTTQEAENGLNVVAVRRASSPVVELRLRIPFGDTSATHPARAELLAATMLLGTARRTRQEVDADLAVVGGHLTADVNPQRLLLTGSVLATGVDVLLDVLADTLAGASYRNADVMRERDRLAEYLMITAAQPAVIARQYLQQRRFGDHPATKEIPDAERVADVSAAAVRGLHRRAVVPQGSTLVLVGDLRPAKVADQAAAVLAEWTGSRPAQTLRTPPAVAGGALLAYHRPGAVQSQTRLSTAGVLRTDADYAAAQLANIVFGGYFSSRLVENLREDKGFTYHAYSTPEFWPGRGAISIGYDTTTDAAAAALVEARYELGRMCVTPPTDAEVDSARHYAIGSLAGSLASQAGYASMLSSLAGSGLNGEWLKQHQRNMGAVTTDDVAAAAVRLFAPSAVTGVVVGNLDTTGQALTRLGGIELSS